MQAMWWCGPQARSAFLCIKWCHLLTKRPIFSWARAEPALARQDYLGGGALKKVKKRVAFCTVSTFQAFCSKSALRATWNQHHPFCSKRGSVPILARRMAVLRFGECVMLCAQTLLFLTWLASWINGSWPTFSVENCMWHPITPHFFRCAGLEQGLRLAAHQRQSTNSLFLI